AAPAAPAAPSADHGKQLFTATCTGCHGNQGQGIPHLGKDLQHSQFAGGLNDSQLADFLIQGRAANDPQNTTHVPMPPKGGNPALSTQDITDIVAYLRQLEASSTAAK
ncbi:MAG TPA: cytochrome c, partial [Verrucomicrobiae bacterium]